MQTVEQILERARAVYGSKNQMAVATEELNELAAVLSKFHRYENEEKAIVELHDRVLDEVADVRVALNHVEAIMRLEEHEIHVRMKLKAERLQRWMDKSSSMEQTLTDREVEEPYTAYPKECCECAYNFFSGSWYSANRCSSCYKEYAHDGHYPNFTPMIYPLAPLK